ncbi:MAG TPA: hypothetical protein VK463_15990 [Desulfomonilaceae bacterium]|nr:hypothetical protein [Desulfomonilaceae bacterium]
MKFTNIFRGKGLTGPIKEADSFETSSDRSPGQVHVAAPAESVSEQDDGYEFGGLYALKDTAIDDDRYYSGMAGDNDFEKFHSRIRQGKVKLCAGCGEVMTKGSRRILSAPSGAALVTIGAFLMIAYGLATNFFQAPWYIKFALPAAYYVGSLFVGVGVLFFFIREKVWYCHRCKEIEKR